jgi:hypothetical protein
MAATLSTGSPKLGKKASANFAVLDQNEGGGKATASSSVSPHEKPSRSLFTLTRHQSGLTFLSQASLVNTSRDSPAPLQTDKLANAQPKNNGLVSSSVLNFLVLPNSNSRTEDQD